MCGETVADLIEQPDGLLRPIPGGSPANTSLALARLGHDTRFLARLSADTFGRRARRRLQEEGVDLSGCIAADEPSTLAVVATDERGHPTYDFWTTGTADWQWTPAELAGEPAAGTRVAHTASVASWTEPGGTVIAEMLERARGDGVLVSYDPNVRPGLFGPDSTDLVRRIVAAAHVVKLSDEDLGLLSPGEDPVDAARALAAAGPTVVVVTLGPAGALAVRTGQVEPIRVPAPQVSVVDTVGAGDTFTAGLVDGLLAALPRDPRDLVGELSALSAEALGDILRRAATAAAINCSRVGCDPPRADELSAALRARDDAPRHHD